MEYLRGGLHLHFGLEHHHHATNTDASPDPSPANPDQYLLWPSREKERDDYRCVRACVLHSDSRFYTTTTGMQEDSRRTKEGLLFSFTHPRSSFTDCTRYPHTRTRTQTLVVRWSFAVAKGKSGSLKAGDETWGWRGRRRTEVAGQGTQSSGIKPSRLLPTSRELPFSLSLSLSVFLSLYLFLSFFPPSPSFVHTLCLFLLSFSLGSLIAVKRRLIVRGKEARVNSSRFYPPSSSG